MTSPVHLSNEGLSIRGVEGKKCTHDAQDELDGLQ